MRGEDLRQREISSCQVTNVYVNFEVWEKIDFKVGNKFYKREVIGLNGGMVPNKKYHIYFSVQDTSAYQLCIVK